MAILKNQRGQLAVFLALIFQVLFVLFAMSINVALVVHDKINLQASADMAAYYVAQKQAEYLHAIAHQNYLIRQSWKLLTWRYRVLGTLGMNNGGVDNHPARAEITNTGIAPRRDEVVWPRAANVITNSDQYVPQICVYYRPNWQDVSEQENLCKEANMTIPELPEYKVIAPFNPLNAVMRGISQQLRTQYEVACAKRSSINWYFAASILKAFREDQKNRKQVMRALASALARDESQLLDLDGELVKTGAENTLKKNLTRANRESLVSIELFNSVKGIDLNKWLVEINILPTLYYSDSASDNKNSGCSFKSALVSQLPSLQKAKDEISNWDQDGFLRQFAVNNDVDFLNFMPDYNYSLGFEKNPWFPVYSGVKVVSQPRQLFFPFGGSITLEAKAFAKPFGGRIGPWFRNTWPDTSGFSLGNKIDDLLPERKNPGQNTIATSPIPAEQFKRLPNYSRYPNDPYGLTTYLAQSAYSGITNAQIWVDYYRNIANEISESAVKDILAWDYSSNTAPVIRNYELAAASPDLFDVTYYSITPNFSSSLLGKIRANKTKLGIPGDVPVRGDLGERFNGNDPVVTTSVSTNLKSVFGSTPLIHPSAFYSVASREGLLTSWLPGTEAFEYLPPNSAWFGKCALWDDASSAAAGPKVANGCLAQGGRAGYSVKMVSKQYLQSSALRLGGSSVSPGRILNPPPW